ncbi:AAA family ATPase [Bacillus sp. AK128]
MIPWRLKFSGIRDYPPVQADLSGTEDHVLITGPNGAGKSTITFCLGAVLYSSKVDIEGLKSRNLPSDQTWKASISLLFKNEGVMKIDAPSFIEFSIKIIQEPGQPIKKEFTISLGEAVDKWEDTIRYSSGDRVYNFTEYKKDLRYKYKIDSDHYYLIWYQQEVNQFAVMHPEERFRIFSEMHGIDKVQRDWEESMEKVKETEETVRYSENNVKHKKAELSLKKTALDRYEDNKKRLNEGATLYIESLLQLEIYLNKEIDQLGKTIDQIKEDILVANDDLNLLKGLREQEKEELGLTKKQFVELDSQIESEKESQKVKTEKIKQIQDNIDTLNHELKELTKKKNKIERTEEEVKSELSKSQNDYKATKEEIKKVQESLNEIDSSWQDIVKKILDLEQQVKTNEKQDLVHRDRLEKYKSSHKVQEEINELDIRIIKNKEVESSLRKQESDLKKEKSLLEENKELSKRQIESLKYFEHIGVSAYPLRELIEMEKSSQLKDEKIFDAIKFTVFYDAKEVSPPNDLYHVSLKNIIPTHMVSRLPELQLSIKPELEENVMPHALKALWWVEQFFKEGFISTENGILRDQFGFRGPQEKERYILSEKALLSRKQEVEKSLSRLDTRIRDINLLIKGDTKSIQNLYSVIQHVRESEAFMLGEHDRITLKEKLQRARVDKSHLEEERKLLNDNNQKLLTQRAEQNLYLETLQREESFYIELGKMKAKYEEQATLEQELELEKEIVKKQKRKIEELEETFEDLAQRIKKSERGINNKDDKIYDSQLNIQSMEKQKGRKLEEEEAAKLELINVLKELADIEKLMREIYKETKDKILTATLPSVTAIKQNRENGRVKFKQARMEDGIDPAAPENYEVIKKEFERLESEYKRSVILLDQDKERMESLKDQLETTVNMRVAEIQKRFKIYMNHFQFEGDISWESYEDRSKRTHFKLFIKARKEGHRGMMEDVSTKARGGRVGKGVSGGEESLSSLLFALALLQNLHISPGFIVLDEFDSALDESRKVKIFDLYERELNRKLIIVTPKSHEEAYLNKFSKAFVVTHNPLIPESKVVGIVKKETV